LAVKSAEKAPKTGVFYAVFAFRQMVGRAAFSLSDDLIIG
jgi:hypothetical protein